MEFERIVILGNGQDWLEKSLHDFESIENGRLVNSILPCRNKFLLPFARFHFSSTVNKFFRMPFKNAWYKLFCKTICEDKEKGLLLIIYDWNKLGCEKSFLEYLRKYFKNMKLVYVITNIITITRAYKNRFVSELKKYYDLVYTFEENDAVNYGFLHSQLVYSANAFNASEERNEVFFAGSAKDRLPMLLKTYERFRQLGLKCNYHILGVPEEEIVPLEGIEYNKRITYQQVIDETAQSVCIIEIPQKNSSEWTIKLCEAIYYNKIFITTNKNILNAPFYDSRYMFVFDNPEDIDQSFFINKNSVCYEDNAREYFSVKRFITMVKTDLKPM